MRRRRAGESPMPPPPGSVGRGATGLLIGRVVSAIAGWAGTVIIARQLSPSDWGGYSFIFGLLGIIGLVVDLQVGRVVLREVLDAGDDAGRVVGSYVVLRLLIGLVAYVAAVAIVVGGGYDRSVVLGTVVAGFGFLLHRAGERAGDLVRGPPLAPTVGGSSGPRGDHAARVHVGRGIRVGVEPGAVRGGVDDRPVRRPRVADPRRVRVPPLGPAQPRPASMVGVAARVDPTRDRFRAGDALLQARHRDAQSARHARVGRPVQHRLQVRRPRQLRPTRAPHAPAGADGRGVAARHGVAAQPLPAGLRAPVRGGDRAQHRLRVRRAARGRAALRVALRAVCRRRPLPRRGRRRSSSSPISASRRSSRSAATARTRWPGWPGSSSTPASTSCSSPGTRSTAPRWPP